jgi:hypothetical protein
MLDLLLLPSADVVVAEPMDEHDVELAIRVEARGWG